MAAVEAVYSRLEAIELPVRNCQARTTCCAFKLTGRTPMLTAGEALVAARGVRASGRKKLPPTTDPSTGRCPLLGSDDRCTIYKRPTLRLPDPFLLPSRRHLAADSSPPQ